MVFELRGTSSDAVSKKLADNEAEVDERGEMTTKRRGTDLGGISWRNNDKHSQDETGQQFSGEKNAEGLGEELNKDDAGSEDNTSGEGEFSTKVIHGVSSKECTENLSDWVAHTESRLPGSFNHPLHMIVSNAT